MSRSFRKEVRVRLSETDALGVVYYGQYLTYFDISRLEMLREVGVTINFLKRRKLRFVAAEVACRYRSSARFDDVLTLAVRVAKIGTTSVVYENEITRRKTRIAEGRVTDVLVGIDGRPARITQDIRRRLARYA